MLFKEIKNVSYAKLAAEIRAMAQEAESDVIRRHLRKIAADYEMLARMIASMERDEAPPPALAEHHSSQ